MMKRAALLGGSLFCALALGCASATRSYPGPKRPPQDVAFLELATNGAIDSINGHPLEGRSYELLPARYTVALHFIVKGGELHPALENDAQFQRHTYDCTADISLEAGHRYEIVRTKARSNLRETGHRQIAGGPWQTFYYTTLLLVEVDDEGNPGDSVPIDCR